MLPRAAPVPPSVREWVAISCITVAAAALRFAFLSSGVPAAVASDEPFLMERAFAMMTTGDFNPRVFDYPSLYMYLQAAVASVRFIVGTLRGEWFRLDEVTASDFYVWGRALTAFIGTLTVLMTWRIGRRLSPAVGLLAAGFLTVYPQHVRDSHFALTDVPMTFFVTLTMLLSIRASESPGVRAFALAGGAAGLAAATKYTAGIALVMPLVALAWTRWGPSDRLRAAGGVGAGAAVAFLIGAPYSVLDLPAFLNGFGHLAMAHAGGPPPATPAWLTYLVHLRIGLGYPLLALAALGLAAGCVRAFRDDPSKRVVWAVATVFVAVFYTELSGQTLVYGRYLLPLVPPLLVLSAAATAGLLAWSKSAVGTERRSQLLAGAVLVLLIAIPVRQTSAILNRMSKTSSNELAFAWMLENLPPGANIAVEAEGMKLPPRFRARNVGRLIDHSYEEYVTAGTEYLVASSLASRGAMAGGPTRDGRAYADLFTHAQLVHVVTETPDHPGSEIRVYRLMPPAP